MTNYNTTEEQPADDSNPLSSEARLKIALEYAHKPYEPPEQDEKLNLLVVDRATEFYTPERLELLERDLTTLAKKSTDGVKSLLIRKEFKSAGIDNFRRLLLAVSFTLSDRGIAPAFQNLESSCGSDMALDALTADGAVIDLYWLAKTFPDHECGNKRWQAIFGSFDFDLSLAIDKRDIHTAAKRSKELELTRFQQIGCIHFCQKQKYSEFVALRKRSKKRFESVYSEQLSKSATDGRLTKEDALYRATVAQAYILGEGSPTDAATIFGWITGRSIKRSTISKTISRIGGKPKKSKPPETPTNASL